MTIFNILLAIHVVSGTIGLFLGSFQLFAKKGSKTHKKIGKIFFYAMVTNALTAMPMSFLHTNYFLFIVGVFGLYMALTGKLYLGKKTLNDVEKTDWLLSIVMFVFAVVFLLYGIYNLIHNNNFGLVFLAFGSIGILFVYQDYKNFTGKTLVKNYWLTTHIQRMVGSYIVAITAFLVINNTILPGVIAWLLPSFLLTPLIVFWSRKYKIMNK